MFLLNFFKYSPQPLTGTLTDLKKRSSRGSVPVRDNPYNLAYKATLHIKIALFCGQIRW